LKTEPNISVITACYNHGRFITEMLESVFNQTFKEYEVIIVNDGSTDNTKEILNSIIQENVTVIHTENNGPANARNTAINIVRAPIIMNLDADDKIAPSLLEKAYKIFCSNPNAGIVHCDSECFGAKSGKFETGEYTLENMLFDNRIISQSFFKRKDWLAVGGYSGEFNDWLEDWDFWLSIIELGGEVVKIPEKLVYYRTYKHKSESLTGIGKAERMKMKEYLIKIFHRHEGLYLKHPMAWEHFSNMETKFINESFLVRTVKNQLYKYMQRYYWK
jgi:glycosyltransferase involved in cell wall biosynthesis